MEQWLGWKYGEWSFCFVLCLFFFGFVGARGGADAA